MSDAFPELPLSRACGGQRPQAAQRKPSVLAEVGPSRAADSAIFILAFILRRSPAEKALISGRMHPPHDRNRRMWGKLMNSKDLTTHGVS